MSTAMQPVVFLACLGAGVFAALVYGLLYVVRLAAKGRRAVGLIADVLFVSISAASYFAVLYYTGFGEMRLYTVAAFLGGFFMLYALLYPLRGKVQKWLERKREHVAKAPRRRRQKQASEEA